MHTQQYYSYSTMPNHAQHMYGKMIHTMETVQHHLHQIFYATLSLPPAEYWESIERGAGLLLMCMCYCHLVYVCQLFLFVCVCACVNISL